MMFGLLLVALLAPPALDETAVVRALKQAERSGHEEHDLDAFLALFARDGRWILGRRAVPDPHDVVFDMRKAREILAIDLKDVPVDQRVEFLKVTATLDADPPAVEFIEQRKFHGGRALNAVRFTLRPTDKGWTIAERRQWPLEDRVGVFPTVFDDAHWLGVDSLVDDMGTLDATERLDGYLAARRYQDARRLALHLLSQPDPQPDCWSFLARAEFRLGNLAAARKAAKRASALGARSRIPSFLLD